MKTLISAIALTFAVPAYAQTAPAAEPAQHKGMGHDQHQQGKHDCKECCEKMKQQGGKMECMDKKADATSADAHADHQGHSAH